MILDFKKFETEANTFINGLAESLGCPDDRDKAVRILYSVLHALRDQLTNEESVQLIAQLPFYLKAVYVSNWKFYPKKPKRIKHYEQFIDLIREKHGKVVLRDFKSEFEIENALRVVFMELRKYVSLGELEDIKAVLPKEMKPILNTVLMV